MRWSRRLYASLLRVYPAEFLDRFRHDLEADFDQLLAQRGPKAAWRRVLPDLVRSLGSTHADASAERRRLTHLDPTGDTSMGMFLFDLRHALRSLARAPGFTAVIIATLALGIGANSAIFSLVNAVLLRPVGFADPDRLMLMYEAMPDRGIPRFGVSPPDYLDLQRLQRTYAVIGAYRNRPFELSGLIQPQQITVAQMTASVFSILGVNAASGRTLVEADEASGERVAVISHGLWQRAFAGRTILGERLALDREAYTVVGVMPATFEFPKRGPQLNGEPADVWVPLVFNPFERQARGMFFIHSVIGRLRDGATVEQASAEASALAPRLREDYPPALRDAVSSLEVQIAPLTEEIAGRVRRALLVLLGAVGLVLLIACANVANLILTRAVVRRREIGLRVALGAARHRLFQMLLSESLVLAAAAGLVGLLIGYWTIRAMPTVIATSLPGVSDVTLDARVVLFTMALSAATAIGFSIVPLAAAGRRDLNDVLREGSVRATTGASRRRLQSTLVVSSVAFAVVLLIGAGLLVRSLNNLLAVDAGVHADNVLTFQVALPHAGYDEAQKVRAFYQSLQAKLEAMPGVRAASISSDLPLDGDGERRAVTPERTGDAGGRPPSMAVTWIHGDYFQTFGIPVVRGRTFTRDEQHENRPVAIVSRALADRFWPGDDPIGKRVKWGIEESTAPWRTVVGTVGDVVDGALGAEPIIHVYVPYSEVADGALASPLAGLIRRMVVAVRGDLDPLSFGVPARAAVTSLDSAMAVYHMTTMSQVMSDASAPQRFSTVVLTGFAAGALLLAGIGLYGMLAFGVTERTREIGVRLALGARQSEVLGLVVRQGMTLAIIGLAIGLAGALAGVRLLEALLFETAPRDVWTFALVPVVLALVAFVACYLPARRASRVDPISALRVD